jgi:diacylglycerol kinase (ATP)
MGARADRPRPRDARHSLAQSFRWAWDGLTDAALRERNMRIHLGLGVLASCAASLLPLDGGEQALLLLTVALVVAGEAANSALEAVVDLVSPGWDERARVAKDAAAAAVLALAAGSVVVLLAVAVPALPALRERWPGLLPAAAGALAAALAAGFLPAPRRTGRAAGAGLLLLGVAGVAAVARSARGEAGVAAAVLLLAASAGAALRRARGSLAAPGGAFQRGR